MAVVPLLAACGGGHSTLSPAGPAARDIALLWWIMLAGSALICVLVFGLLVLAVRNNGARRSERTWIWGWGLGFSMSVLVVLLGFSLWLGEGMLARADNVPRVQAHAAQWEWRFDQPGPDGAIVQTRDTLYVPAGQDFDVVITAQDVIHSFWVPQLGGKMDAIPGHQNIHRLRADQPGTYEGLCAEFCGTGHSFMRFTVVAYDPNGPMPDMSGALIPETRP
ncbi:cytochrome c oxidase subunit II [Paracoccus sp. NFXS7]|uniref:cytochrome c oxidase subunit II n=1 Tax=Paracoccus sp. NFXS7 TaxID=2908653 RepID=UPI0032E0444A